MLQNIELEWNEELEGQEEKEIGEKKTVVVADDHAGVRIDKYLTVVESEISRSYLQKLIADQLVTVNGKIVKANYKVGAGEQVSYIVPHPVDLNVEPEDIPLDILYEDDDIIVVNKPKGMVVHPAAGHYSGTLVNALMYHCKDKLSGINGVMRPGIVHRIDMNTTGVLVVCKNCLLYTSPSPRD